MRLIALLLVALNLLGAGAQRIVSTAPSITEILFAMGLGPRVVGDTTYCNYPPEARKLPRIGTLLKPDVEQILALKPDLVVVLDQPENIGSQLTRVRVKNITVNTRNLAEVYATARAIGKAANAEAAAERMIGDTQRELGHLKELTAGKPKPSILFIVGHAPGSLEGLYAGAGTSYFSDLLESAGGRNVFADVATPFPTVTLEEIVSRNPDVILELSGDSKAQQREVLALWQKERSLKAVSSGRVYVFDSTPFLVPGPRAVEAARRLLKLLHPEINP